MSIYTFLPKLLNMSLMASVAIVCVLLLRLLLKKAPKVISYCLWAVVLFRLLCPVSVSSAFSLFGIMDLPAEEMSVEVSSMQYVPKELVPAEALDASLNDSEVREMQDNALPQRQEQMDGWAFCNLDTGEGFFTDWMN